MSVHSEMARMRARLDVARTTLEVTTDDEEFAQALAEESRCLLEIEALSQGPEGGFPGHSEDA